MSVAHDSPLTLRMKPATLTTVAAAILIGTAGFIAGRVSSPAHSGNSSGTDHNQKYGSGIHESEVANADGASTSRYAKRREQTRILRTPERPDPLERLSTIMRSEDPLERGRLLLDHINRLGIGDFESAVAHFRSLGITESRMGEYAQLLAAWAKADPVAALAYAEKNTRSGFATNTILTSWAINDPESAIRWAESKHEGDEANPYYAGIIRALAATDPERAQQLLTSMPKSVERGEALDAMMPHVLSQGAEATREWIANLADDSLRNGAMLRSAEQLATIDPSGTAAWLMENPGEASQRRMDDVYRVWARTNADEAIQSFTTMPAGEARSNALRGVVNALAADNPQSAVAMLDQYPDDVTDRAVQNVVWHSFGSDPSLAVSQISRMTDERDRNRTYQRMLQAWQERDPAAARQWLQTHTLPAPVLQALQPR